jgi:CubicO group peptidase (beta-lactamase class C family)
MPLLTSALLLLAASAQALLPAPDVLRAATPVEAGLDADLLRAAVVVVEEAAASDAIRGAVVLVARHGRIAVHEAFGWRDLAGESPMERDTLFRLASNTKPVIAAAVLQLVDAGALDLDDAVGEHLPTFAASGPDAILVRHLLAHTSGLRIETIFLDRLLPDSLGDEGLQREVARFGAIGPKVPPGTSYAYSNPGYNTLGALVEVAAEMPLKRYLRERVYVPLGMHDACNHEPDADPERMSGVFVRTKAGAWRARWTPGDPPDYPFVRASGGMIASARDYATFCQALLQGGVYAGRRVLAEDSVRGALAPQNLSALSEEERAARQFFYGFGWSVRRDGLVAHSGSDGTFAWIDPTRGIVGLYFTQSPGACDAFRWPLVEGVERAADAFDGRRDGPR